MGRDHHRRGVVLVACLGLALMGATGGAAADVPDRAFEVALHEDGSATVSITYTYDLNDDEERQALRELQNNQSVRQAMAEQFSERLQRVAVATAERTGREMAVENTQIDVVVEDGTGAVTVTVTWTGLAAIDGDTLTISEPFASEFTPDRELRVIAPDGYTIEDASPAPANDDGDTVSWPAGTDLSGFSVTASTQSSGASGPGFGFVPALAAIGIAAGVIFRARRR